MSKPPDTPPDPPASEITDSSELGPLIKQALAQDPDSDRCVTWAGRVDSHGFPWIRAFRRVRPLAVVVYELPHHKQLPPSVMVRQTCNNKVCMRKEHLYPDPKFGFLSRAEFEKGPRPKLLAPPDATASPEDTDEGSDGS